MFATDVDFEDLTAEAELWVDSDRHFLPADLDRWEPGVRLTTVLSSIDRSKLSGYDLVILLRARNRQVAHDQAEMLADMAEISHCVDPEMGRDEEAFDYASDEIRAALMLTRRAAESELDFATELHEGFRRVWKALHGGMIDVRRARTIVHATSHLDLGTASAVVDQIIDKAPELTTGQLRSRIQRLCIETDSDEAKKRFDSALGERRVTSHSNPEGTANLFGLDLPPHKVAAVRGRIETIARRLRQTGDGRTMDQLRADIYLDLLLSSHGEERNSQGGNITMTASLETLAGLSSDAADLPGLGPIISDIARQVLEEHPQAELQYKIATSNGGAVIGTPSRHATRALRRFIQTRDETCMGVGCRMPAGDCDVDHRERWADGGSTDDRNSDPLCRHDHMLKDSGGWRGKRNTDGAYTWISRLGHSYTTGRSP